MLPPATVRARVLPAVVAAAGDAVPNVRFGAAKGFEALAKAGRLDNGAAAAARAALAGLRADADPDVRYYATRALAALSS